MFRLLAKSRIKIYKMSLKKVVICEDIKVQSAREARSRSRGRFRSRRSKSQIVFPTQEECQEKAMKRDRSLINLMRTGSRTSVRNLVRLFEMKVVRALRVFMFS